MSQPRVGEKRGRDSGVCNKALKFIPGLTLSQHPPGQRKQLFLKKLGDVIVAKSLHPTEFEGYTIRERFEKMGWEQLLNLSCDKIYKQVVIQWVASLSRNEDELTGIVDGKSYTITPAVVRDVLGVDTRKDLPYARFNEADLRAPTVENKTRWKEACKTVFGLKKNAKKKREGYDKLKMTPLVQLLWQIGVSTFHPRLLHGIGSLLIYPHEIFLLHALVTGDYAYSFAHLMIDDIWNMYEQEHRRNVPHGYYISEILRRLGAVSEDEYVQVIAPQHRLITIHSIWNLDFSKSSTEYIIDDWVTLQRVTFPVKFIEKKPHSELITMVTNIQKQLERYEQASERREQERERREQEREKQEEIRTHAIIWNMERQRYFYEQEQEQLHIAWNKAYGSEEFQFPRISHMSFHPPQAESRYYDPTQGNEIPKAFQDLFHDIYGTKS